MQQIALISSALIVSGTLCLSSCDDKLQQEKSQAQSRAMEPSVNITVQKKHQQAKEVGMALDPVTQLDAREYKKSKEEGNAIVVLEKIVSEENQQAELIYLDLSLNIEIQEFNKLPYARVSNHQKLLRGIFESEAEEASSLEMETHFEGPHNENKEREMTPDGVGVKFKLDF